MALQHAGQGPVSGADTPFLPPQLVQAQTPGRRRVYVSIQLVYNIVRNLLL